MCIYCIVFTCFLSLRISFLMVSFEMLLKKERLYLSRHHPLQCGSFTRKVNRQDDTKRGMVHVKG